jgi:Zn-dependent peptidase ImmA (M78 family)
MALSLGNDQAARAKEPAEVVMETLRVGGRTYRDPDVISLIRQTGGFVDPRSSVVTQARRIVNLYQQFDGAVADPIERVKIIASLVGIKVLPMDIEQQRGEKRDAVLVHTPAGKVVPYNPRRPSSRVAFSIAHEIAHTFFPNSTRGTRFRHIVADGSKEARELEGLCDLGAAEIVLPLADFVRAIGGAYSIQSVDRLCRTFGTSFEATLFRLATAHPGIAVAGLLKYRYTVGETRQLSAAKQQHLFAQSGIVAETQPVKKYRRQSLFLSEACDDSYTIRWNKSFDPSSCVYKAGHGGVFEVSYETLPNEASVYGKLEAIRAPYQREDADEEYGDVLFFWEVEEPQ